ncbi:hypothetical protein LBMAG52_29210 [Planctomycetia bacterium]|nr:hypothetical protein LBMAG52_29210 [Planctomycetia bacterium]
MKSQWMLSVLIAGMMATVGCQANRAVVRGQNPASFAPGANGPMGPNGPAPGPMSYDGPAGAHSASRPPPPEWARNPSDSPENYHSPKHHHTFDYRQPKNLSYPPQNQPAGVVAYPYYTCKGPSDFFMK